MSETNTYNMDQLKVDLEQKEQMEALHYLVQKLPDFTKRIQDLDDKLSFAESVFHDKQSMELLGDEFEEKVDQLNLSKEHFDAVLEMMHMLPKLMPLIKQLEEITAFVTDAATDPESVDYALKGLNDVIPVEKSKQVIQETNTRFQEQSEMPDLSMMKMYQLLKDPTVQKGLKYVKTMLDVVNNR